jgi:hypothetical protein
MFDNKLWLSEKFTKAQAWVDLFANANHQDGSFWVRGNEVEIKRGQLGWSEITMADRWSWSRDKVRRFLGWLESESQIRQQKSTITTIISIVNYDRYQPNDTTNKTAERQQKDSRQDTNKNDKNEENEKKGSISPNEVNKDFFLRGEEYNRLKGEYIKKYGDETTNREFTKFVLCWTEPNKSGTKVRWEQQPTFDVKRRLFTWFSKSWNK